MESESDEIKADIDAGRLIPLGPPAELTKPAFGRTLRIALAMKGGISLAVWIGGTVAELDVLRRIRILGTHANPTAYLITDLQSTSTSTPPEVEERAKTYAKLLMSRGYDKVEFDVLAGASAGGLNAVLYGVAQRAGVGTDGVLATWVKAGAIRELLHRPGFRGLDSVLQGDDYFWGEVKNAIQEVAGRTPNELHRARQVVVDLSATVVDHDDPRDVGIGERGGHFHFVGDSHSEERERRRGIPEVIDPMSAARLAYAARTTSSFPFAFEPALVWSPQSELTDTVPTDRVEMSFAFHAHRGKLDEPAAERRPFRVIDGGVLDNMPIDRALRAVRDMPADRYVTRALFFLEPDPPRVAREDKPSAPIEPPPVALTDKREPKKTRRQRRALGIMQRNDEHSGFFRTIARGIFGRGVSESREDELEAVEAYRRSLLLDEGRDPSYAVIVRAAAASLNRSAARAAYVGSRVTQDLDTLTRLTSNPSLWQLGTDLPDRRELHPVSDEVRQGLLAALRKRYVEPDTGAPRGDVVDAIEGGSQALVDATRAALAWIRELEQVKFDFTGTVASYAESERNQLRVISQFARAERDRRYDQVLKGIGSKSPLQIVEDWVDQESAALILESNESLSPEPDPWKRLDGLVTRLRELGAGYPPDSAVGQRWSTSPWAALETVEGFEAKDVAPFAAARGIPESVFSMELRTISGAEPAAVEFPGLRAAQRATIVQSWMGLSKPRALEAARRTQESLAKGEVEPLDANAKLAGSALWSFGAFLSADWRRNDWWWGRLDVGAGISRFLLGLPARTTPEGDAAAPEFDVVNPANDIQQSILRQAQASDQPPFPTAQGSGPAQPATVEGIAAAMTAGAHTLRNLGPSYLVGIASRLAHAVVRSAAKGGSALKSVGIRLGLPPFLIAVPMVAQPIRAIAAAALILMVVSFGPTEPPRPEDVVQAYVAGGLVTLLAVLFLVNAAVTAVRTGRIWKKVPAVYQDDVKDWRRRAVTYFAVSFVVAILALLGASFLLLLDQGLSGRFWTLFVAGAGFATYAGSIVKRMPAAPIRRFTTWVWTILTGLAILLSIAAPLVTDWALATAPDLAEPMTTNLAVRLGLTHGVIAALLAFVLGFGWLGVSKVGIVRVLTLIVLALAIGALVGWVSWAIAAWFGGNAVFTATLAAALISWIIGANAFWWLGDVPFLVGGQPKDTAHFYASGSSKARA